MDIICRVWLSDAPSEKHEEIVRKLDGDNYKPDCFFIECIAGKNEPYGDILTSDWLLYYVLENGEHHEFGFVSEMEEKHDVDEGAWEFFKKEVLKDNLSLDDKIASASKMTIKSSECTYNRQINIEL